MPDQSMIERVARAMEREICRQTGEGEISCFIADGCLALGDEHSNTEIVLPDLARAVLTAMREPTAVMLDGVSSMLEQQDAYMDCSIIDVWGSAIDAALEDGRC